MRRGVTLSLVVAVALGASPAFADDAYVGTITSTGTSVTNGTTSSTFATSGLEKRAKVSVQCDAAAYVRTVATSATAVTSSNGVKLAADQLYDIDLSTDRLFIAVISVSGTANCRVYYRK